jgi:hypothetical protein
MSARTVRNLRRGAGSRGFADKAAFRIGPTSVVRYVPRGAVGDGEAGHRYCLPLVLDVPITHRRRRSARRFERRTCRANVESARRTTDSPGARTSGCAVARHATDCERVRVASASAERTIAQHPERGDDKTQGRIGPPQKTNGGGYGPQTGAKPRSRARESSIGRAFSLDPISSVDPPTDTVGRGRAANDTWARTGGSRERREGANETLMSRAPQRSRPGNARSTCRREQTCEGRTP